MTTGPDIPGPTGRDPDTVLTPEERKLAERIAPVGRQREPAPELDARILAAARAAVAAPAARQAGPRLHPRRRWPVVTGVAATLVLAVGLAWQLRPVDDTRVGYSEAPRALAIPAPGGGPSDVDGGSPVEAEQANGSPTPSQEAARAPEARRAPVEADTAAASAAREVAPQPAPAEAPVVFDEPSPMDAPAPPAAFEPPPAPAAPPAPSPAPATARRAQAAQAQAESFAAASGATAAQAKASAPPSQARDDAAMAGAARKSTAIGNFAVEAEPVKARNEAEAADADAGTLDRVEVSGTRIDRFADQPLDDQPPASADSPQVQQAWLQRVRQLVAEGRLDAARDSLREYQHRYPEAALPDDLRALLEQ